MKPPKLSLSFRPSAPHHPAPPGRPPRSEGSALSLAGSPEAAGGAPRSVPPRAGAQSIQTFRTKPHRDAALFFVGLIASPNRGYWTQYLSNESRRGKTKNKTKKLPKHVYIKCEMRMMNTQKGANRRKPQARSCAQPPAPGSAIERSTAGTKPLRELFGGGFQCPPPPGGKILPGRARLGAHRDGVPGHSPAHPRAPLPAPMPIRQPSSVSAFSLPVCMNGTRGGGGGRTLLKQLGALPERETSETLKPGALQRHGRETHGRNTRRGEQRRQRGGAASAWEEN